MRDARSPDAARSAFLRKHVLHMFRAFAKEVTHGA